MPVNLFEPYRIGKLELRNRFVRSATWDGSADESGAVTDASIALYQKLGQGGVGLIVSGYAFVSSEGRAAPGQYGAYTDAMIPGLCQMVEAAHQKDSKIALQIVHAGVNSAYLQRRGLPAHAVSPRTDTRSPHREMTDEEIESIIEDFARAAVRGREAGFDAIQLHGAHGYLMSQFISPLYNQRTDRWGGSPENRRRFHLEVVGRIRKTLGHDFPLLIKFGIQDDLEGGLPLDEGIDAARGMVSKGLDAIEVSLGVGSPRGVLRHGEPEKAALRDRSAALKKEVDVPVILVNGIRSPGLAQDIVDKGEADLIAMCRPFIREPGLIARWERGDTTPAVCVSCGKCLALAARGDTLECWEEYRARK